MRHRVVEEWREHGDSLTSQVNRKAVDSIDVVCPKKFGANLVLNSSCGFAAIWR